MFFVTVRCFSFRKNSTESIEQNQVANMTTSLFSQTVNCTIYGSYSETCDYNGICRSDETCKCDDGYITFPSNHYPYCNYKQKNQLVAFLLELFLGYFGVGEFYIGQNGIAIVQLVLSLVGICIVPLIMGFLGALCGGEGLAGLLATISAVAVVLTTFGLWLAYTILIGTGMQNDSNGAPLYGM
jgi:TM2 domain-containing membrane protein YozV